MKSFRKKSLLLTCGLLLLAATGFVETVKAENLSRIRYTIDDNWKFFPGDIPDSKKRDFQDSSWQKVSVPHTWNAEDAFDDEPGYRRGPGWYRRQLNVNSDLKGKRIFLYFEGANQTAEVYLNERFVGRHIGGYTAFVFDVTDFIEFETPNLIAVKVDNTLDKEKPPINGDFTMYGGIYRDVWLMATDEIQFKVTDYASPGVTVETPQVTEKSANVRVSGTIVNSSARTKQIEIVSTIFDAENRSVASISSKLTINAGSEAGFEQISRPINNPQLWSPDNPYLYKIQSVVKDGETVLDEITNPLGFRWFKFDAEQGFSLNGKPLKLRGTNKHQDYFGLGNAVPDRLQVRDLEIIKENGFNFLRLAHYPQDPSVLAAADRLGLLVWEEIPIVNQIAVSDAFNENAKRMLREMIRQHRNHPSVIIWGYMNEVFLPVPKEEAVVQATVKLARELEEICRAEDAGRATAIAFDHGARQLYHTSKLDGVTQIIGWNLYHGWYYESFEDFGKFLDEEHRQFPDRPLIVSEYGANGDRRLHALAPKRFDSTIEWQRMYHEAYLPQINARKFLAGATVWNQFDFGSEARGETIPHINQKGLYTYDRRPKDISYFYKANFSGERMIHIATHDWQRRSGNPKQTIDVYTNFPGVELFQDGVSRGVKSTINRKASWEVNLSEGKNTFTARTSVSKDTIFYFDTAEVFFTNYAAPFDESFREIAVNVGSNADYVDESKTVWTADRPYQAGGGWGFIGDEAKAISTGRNVLGSLDDPLFQTMQENLKSYRFDVADGDYEIELRFAEPKFKESGQRVFDVNINGQPVLKSLDLAKESGLMQSFGRKFQVSVRNKQGILIGFTARADKPVLSGVRVYRMF